MKFLFFIFHVLITSRFYLEVKFVVVTVTLSFGPEKQLQTASRNITFRKVNTPCNTNLQFYNSRKLHAEQYVKED